jgi:hypothetical protein
MPDEKPRVYRWTITLWKADSPPKKAFVASSREFLAYTETIEETFELLWQQGFCCVRKNDRGQVIAAGDFQVRLSQGGL